MAEKATRPSSRYTKRSGRHVKEAMRLNPVAWILLLLCCSNHCLAAIRQGTVRDASSGEALASVYIENKRSGTSTFSDTSGRFTIMVDAGDSVQCSSVGYHRKTIVVSGPANLPIDIELNPQSISIDTVEVKYLTPYQRDSLKNRELYGTEVDRKPIRFTLAKADPLYGGGSNGSLKFDGPLSSLIQKRTRKYKKRKAFQDRFREDDRQAYMDSRYTPDLVTRLTGLTGDSLRLFMLNYPIAYDFSRAASELELMMWVKYNYRIWPQRQPAARKEP